MQRGYLRGLWIIILAGIALGLNRALPARAQTQVVESCTWIIFLAGRSPFWLNTSRMLLAVEARFYFRRPEDKEAIMVPATLDDQGVLTYEYDFMRFPLRAFSRVEYRFEVVIDGGETVSSSQEVFPYEDNRFVWQSMQSGPFRVHWYDGDAAFGQELLDVAQRGLQQAQSWLLVATLDEPDEMIDIYTYASKEEMRSTLLLGGTNWVAGHADPDMQLIVVSIPPGPEQSTEMERQIPHELMHTLLYLTVGPDY